MFTLVLGENNSGKSSYAERLMEQACGTKRYYIATMIPYGEAGKARVEKHIKMREHLQMITLEDPFLTRTEEVPPNADVLLEDLSNLVANRMFEKGKESTETIVQELIALHDKVRNLVVVSISGMIAEQYQEETACYIRTLNAMNEALEIVADQTVKMGEGR